MITPILVPKLGMSTSEDVTVVKWIKSDGEPVEKGEPVVIIETAKVTHEIEAQASGTVFKLKKVKDKVKIGDPLGVVADSREEFEAYKETLAKEPEVTAGLVFEEGEDETEEGIRLSFEEEEERPPVAPTASAVYYSKPTRSTSRSAAAAPTSPSQNTPARSHSH